MQGEPRGLLVAHRRSQRRSLSPRRQRPAGTARAALRQADQTQTCTPKQASAEDQQNQKLSAHESLEHETGKLLFAANAGMFDPALKPVGLYVEQGRELVRVRTASGYGNLHMKPNGIKEITIQDGGLLAREDFTLESDFADIEPIAQEMGERTARERAPSDRASGL